MSASPAPPPRLFRGLIAFPITPMDADGVVDVAALRGLVRRLVEAEVDGIGVLGSTGSYPYLSRNERRRALDAALAEVDGRFPVMAGVGALRTDEAVRLTQDAKAAGADAGLLAPVSYTPLTEDEVFAHFEAVAATGLPLCIYNNPGTTHFTFSDALIERLATLPGVHAVKNPAPEPAHATEVIAALRARTPEGFSVGYSTDWNATEALIGGGDAWYSVLAGLFPEQCMNIRRAVASGDIALARDLNARLAPLWASFKAHSSLRIMYAAANRMGLTGANPPLPILPLARDQADSVKAVLADLDLG